MKLRVVPGMYENSTYSKARRTAQHGTAPHSTAPQEAQLTKYSLILKNERKKHEKVKNGVLCDQNPIFFEEAAEKNQEATRTCWKTQQFLMYRTIRTRA